MKQSDVLEWAERAGFSVETHQVGGYRAQLWHGHQDVLETFARSMKGNAIRDLGAMIRLIQAAPRL